MSDTELKPSDDSPDIVLPAMAEQDEEAAWNLLAAQEFLKGYAESDAIYDSSLRNLDDEAKPIS